MSSPKKYKIPLYYAGILVALSIVTLWIILPQDGLDTSNNTGSTPQEVPCLPDNYLQFVDQYNWINEDIIWTRLSCLREAWKSDIPSKYSGGSAGTEVWEVNINGNTAMAQYDYTRTPYTQDIITIESNDTEGGTKAINHLLDMFCQNYISKYPSAIDINHSCTERPENTNQFKITAKTGPGGGTSLSYE